MSLPGLTRQSILRKRMDARVKPAHDMERACNKRSPAMQTIKLTRELPVLDGYDVLVAGGGPAGSAAAVCAARLGARVLLVEASGCLGGMCTAGLVTNFGPMSDGERPLVGGFTRQLIETLYERDVLG